MSRPFGSKNNAEEAARLRFACRKVTDKVVRAWVEALDAVSKWTDGEGVEHSEPNHDIRIKAANSLADRGYGKPAQEVNASIEVTDASPDDLYSRIATIVASAAGDADSGSTGEPH